MRPPFGPKEDGLPRFHLTNWLAVAWLVAACVVPSAGQAHAILLGGTPAIGATVAPGRLAIELRFNSRIDRGRSRLRLVAPDQSVTVLPITADAPAEILHAEAELKPGSYTIRWQVLSVDGHITRGDVPFVASGK